MLCYIIFHYIILYYIISYSIILVYIILCYIILNYIISYYIILYYITLYHITLYYIILYYIYETLFCLDKKRIQTKKRNLINSLGKWSQTMEIHINTIEMGKRAWQVSAWPGQFTTPFFCLASFLGVQGRLRPSACLDFH